MAYASTNASSLRCGLYAILKAFHRSVSHRGRSTSVYIVFSSCLSSDDKIEGLRLSSAFDLTCTAWKERFNVQYTYCGCPLPGDTIGQRLSRIVGKYAPPAPSHLLPVDRPDFLSATHPSDHNAVRFQPSSESAHKKATKRYEQLAKKKLKEREKAIKKATKDGKLQGAVVLPPHLQQERRAQDARNAYMYDTAFLVPVPLYYYGAAFIGGGIIGGGIGGCVAGGGFANNAGGCATVR